MSNTSINEIKDTKYYEKQHENDTTEQNNVCASQKEESELSKNKVKVESIEETLDTCIKVINLEPVSTVADDTVIDMQDKVHQNRNMKEEYLNQQKRPTTWVQFSFGEGSGGFSIGKGDFDYDPESRNTFVLLVMLITLVMLLITVGWLVLVFQVESLFNMFRKPSMLMLFGVPIILMMVWYAISCIPCASRPPCIFIMMLLVLVFMCLLAAIITCRYNTVIVMYAFMATTAVVFVCTILACTSFDFTSFWLYFVGISLAFSVIALIVMIGMLASGSYLKPLHLVILCVSTVLQAVGLIMELQMILGGKSIEMNENDYALGALLLYGSIIQIFLNMVQIIGLLND